MLDIVTIPVCAVIAGADSWEHIEQFAKAKHPIPGMLRQVQVFEKHVKPRLEEQKTAYVWVDALRFEMARELGEVLKGDFDLTLQPALATIPTITEIGMASLVPRADQVDRLTESETKRIDPSHRATLTPPECRLRAALYWAPEVL